MSNIGFWEDVSLGDTQEVEAPDFGATPPIFPEWTFQAKKFVNIKDARIENLEEYCPMWFEELSEIDGVYLGGGSLRNLLGGDDVIADIDIFFKNKTSLLQAIEVMQRYDGSESGDWYEAFRCPANELITYKTAIEKHEDDRTPEDYKSQKKIQFITKSFYNSPEDLINTFDFIPTCACLYKGALYTHPDWVQHVKKRTLGLHFISYPVASVFRMMKYKDKGYHVLTESVLEMVTQINMGDFEDGQLALYVD
tara:strand:+ start:1283 stop:2038 length:756 start_codon:yes stop_codon:yes gene_type:complete